MLGLKTVLSTIAAVTILTGAAQATTVQITNPYSSLASAQAGASFGNLTPGGSLYALRPDQSVLVGSFNNFYKFDVTPNNILADTLVAVHVAPPDPQFGGVKNLTMSWLDAGGNSIFSLNITDSTGTYIPPTVDGSIVQQALLIGTVFLKVTGDRVDPAGRYDFDIAAEPCPNCAPPGDTPIPGAAFLFGSVVAGGLGGVQVMRRRRTVRAN
jgi:hypothetical protein